MAACVVAVGASAHVAYVELDANDTAAFDSAASHEGRWAGGMVAGDDGGDREVRFRGQSCGMTFR